MSPDTTSPIDDLGYHRYEGARDGARGAWRALFVQGFRTMFGFGRPAKSKAIPVFLITVSLLPCLGALAAMSATQGQVPIRYNGFVGPAMILFVLFSAAQAPEVLSRDQQHRVLPLILTRDVTRAQYASARITALMCAMLIVCSAPLLLLYIGQIGVAADPVAAFSKMGAQGGPVLLQGTLMAWVIGGVAAAIASMTPRRAYASASIIGLFLTTTAISLGLNDLTGVSPTVTELMSPINTLNTMMQILFGETTRAMELTPPPPLWVLAGTSVVTGAVGVFAAIWRLRKVSV